MDRRAFIKAGTVLTAAAALPVDVISSERKELKVVENGVRRDSVHKPLDIREIEIKAGARKTFRALHVSDSHLTRVDARDDQRKINLAASRYTAFPEADYFWYESLRYAKDNNLLFLHTGDFADFVSEALLDEAAASFRDIDCFVSCGNHEFSKYVGEAKEDEPYKASSFDKVQDAYPNDLKVCSRIVNGVNLVSFDNVYYYVTEDIVSRVKAEFEKGYPVILMCHVPFYTPGLCRQAFEDSGRTAGYVMGAPEEITSTYRHDDTLPEQERWRNRDVQQHSDKTTLEFIDWLKGQSQLKAILCGHCHFFWEERFSDTAMQYVAGAGYKGQAYKITIR